MMQQTNPAQKQSSDKFLSKMLNLHQESLQLQEVYQKQVINIDLNKGYLLFKEITDLPNIFALRLIHDFLLKQKIKFIIRSQIENIYQLILQNKGNWRIELHEAKVAFGKMQKLQVR